MKKIIAITCHKITNPLIHTVKYFSSFTNNNIIIHVDSKSNLDEFLFLENTNVSFLVDRCDITWGGVSQIKATLKMIEYAASRDFDYFFLISGDDIPIMNNREMDQFLNENYGCDFIHFQDSRNIYVEPKDRVLYRYPKSFYKRSPSIYDRFVKKIFNQTKGFFFKNRNLHNIQDVFTFYKGTNWFTLTRDSIEYINLFLIKNPSFLGLFEFSLCADEIFFHSILKTKGSLKLYSDQDLLNDALRYIDWSSGPQYPRVLDNSDKIHINKKYFFARKFNSDTSFEFMESFL